MCQLFTFGSLTSIGVKGVYLHILCESYLNSDKQYGNTKIKERYEG